METGVTMIKAMQKHVLEFKPLFESIQWEDDEAYATWLSQAYRIVLKSVPYLELCHAKAAAFPDFHKRLGELIAEEKGHEKLIVNDLAQLGIKAKPEFPTTSLVYQFQPYQIEYVSPRAFLGYVFFLELLAPNFGSMLMSRIRNKKALTFLKVHTEDDVDHVDAASKILEKIPEATLNEIWHNFQMTSIAYKAMLEEIASQRSSSAKAA